MDSAIVPETTKTRLTINVEVDEKTYLFPDGKLLSHITVSADEHNRIALDAVFVFNASRLNPRFWVLDLDDARDFTRKVIDTYYQGKTQHVLSDTAKIAILFNPNGFLIQFGDLKNPTELFIGASSIMRFVHGMLRVIDSASPIVAH